MAAAGDDLKDFYDAGLGPTRSLTVTAAGETTPDEDGPLPPGRYLIQATDPGGSDVVWMQLVPFKKGSAPTITAAVPAFPFATVRSIEVHVRPNHNDRIVARTTGASATIYITRLSRITKAS